MPGKDDFEPSRPWPIVALGYVAALVLTVVVAAAIAHLTGWDHERVFFGTFGALLLLSAYPRAWWLWEVGDIEAFAEIFGIKITRTLFLVCGLGLIGVALFGTW